MTDPNIVCVVCGARPFPPKGSNIRLSYDLIKLVKRQDKKDGGVFWEPADETEGKWFCERHRCVRNSRFFVAEDAPPP
jgi:hypothetical protein